MKNSLRINILIPVFISGLLLSCSNKDDTTTATNNSETTQQVGETMASIDEAGGSSGSIALLDSAKKTYARLAPKDLHESWLQMQVLPRANAAACSAAGTFGSCTNNVITRTFSGCTIGAATFNGTVELTWTDGAVNNTCQMTASGHSIARNPNFTVTGLHGATLSVTKSGTNGQVITRGATANNLTFSNDGIRRVFTTGGGTTLLDFSTQTTSDIGITGAARNGRVVNGGALRVTNNLSGVTCDYAPSNVTWTAACNCATSGSWTSTCSDGKSSTVTLTGCGTANYTMGTESGTVTFDRCY